MNIFPKPLRRIRQVAVIGSGVMGSRIACHLANKGFQVLLLDIVPQNLTEDEQRKNLSLEHPEVRNRIVNQALKTVIAQKPESLYHPDFAQRIRTGNIEDDLHLIAGCQWIVEAVIEKKEIKQQVFERVEQFRTSGTLVSTNTSGIPVSELVKGRSEDFRKHFIGTHFFNPPRYLKLLEIIPSPETLPQVTDFFMDFGTRYLGKTTVLCKDTPAFIANRIGVFSMMYLFRSMEKSGLSIAEVDLLTGPLIGRPKSATFRTADVVGIDTLVHVACDLYQHLPLSSDREIFKIPDFLEKMVQLNRLGQKTGDGFYKKIKNPDGGSEILSLNLQTLEYEKQQKRRFSVIDTARTIEKIQDRLQVLISDSAEPGSFYRDQFFALFQYVTRCIPEISDDIYKIDDAMRAGFGWELGPFEMFDALGVEETVKTMESTGFKLPSWVHEMLASGCKTFYRIQAGKKQYYKSGNYYLLPGREGFIILSDLNENKIWSNAGCTLMDIGDGVLNLAFHTKMNTVGSEVLAGIRKSIDIAEEQGWRGLVIANEGAHFSAGANLALILMLALEQEWDELNMAVKAFQQCNMRIRYSDIPVVIAPHGMTLGGGCEMCLHADAVVADPETYIGLVELGVGLIPGGGGTKEFALRASDEMRPGDVRINVLRERFLTIGMAKVSTSAQQAFGLGIFRPGIDRVVKNGMRRIAEAKTEVIRLAEGYTRPIPRTDITVLGNEGLGIVYAGANSMYAGHYISDHDKLISEKLGYVMCGGPLSEPTRVSEDYLLDLERETFLSLLGTKPTLERIRHMLTTGKPLRN